MSILSVGSALAWIADFCSHTFFLLPLTACAAVPILTTPDNFVESFFESRKRADLLPTPPLACPLGLRENSWVLAAQALCVVGWYALDGNSGPSPGCTSSAACSACTPRRKSCGRTSPRSESGRRVTSHRETRRCTGGSPIWLGARASRVHLPGWWNGRNYSRKNICVGPFPTRLADKSFILRIVV